ncbi:MAG: GNAT family N-acetyltransferase, partial [Ktedonobacteraceae bacterium]|nr:GNAT family N-acetyltransferase [Ktedonobacteraceae bacterium]
LLWTWWRGDTLPLLPPLPGLAVEKTGDIALLASMMEISPADARAIVRKGDTPYLARLDAQPVAYGWSASGDAAFGGGLVKFRLPHANRYLYDFVTLPRWRGLGIYPRLLQAIVERESAENERFWIVHQQENVASARGIAKAGFRIASEVFFLTNGALGLATPPGEAGRAHTGAELLRLPLVRGDG